MNYDDFKEFEYKELPRYGGNALHMKAEKLEREGWEFLEYRGSRIIYRRKKEKTNEKV